MYSWGPLDHKITKGQPKQIKQTQTCEGHTTASLYQVHHLGQGFFSFIYFMMSFYANLILLIAACSLILKFIFSLMRHKSNTYSCLLNDSFISACEFYKKYSDIKWDPDVWDYQCFTWLWLHYYIDYNNCNKKLKEQNSKVFLYLTPFARKNEESEIKIFNPGPWHNFCKIIILVLVCFTVLHLKV